MPLVRAEVRNEYGLGQPELYGHASSDDTKAVLDGVAVAGLVGILRQLGDLAEFAAEVFHGLQEQVMNTSSRSHKLRVRAQNIEAALPRLEKGMLAQTSHIHFAYSAGSDWHPHIQIQQNQLIYNDLPRFIMDHYEECRYPPSLHMLDKFDIGGPGSCLKRYSDPTYFKRASDGNDENAEKIQRYKKARKSKKKKPWRNGHVLHSESMPSRSTRMQFTTSNVNGKTSPQPAFTFSRTSKPVLGTKSKSFDSRSTSNYNEFHFDSTRQPEEESAELLSFRLRMQNSSRAMQPEEEELEIIPSPKINRLHSVDLDSAYLAECNRVVDGDLPSSSFVTWEEKTEIVGAKVQQDDGYSQMMLPTGSNLETQEIRSTESFNEADIHFDNDNIMLERVKCNVEQDGSDKSLEILATDSHLDLQERVSIDYVKIDNPYISEPFPDSISRGDQLNEIESDTKVESPEMLAVDSNLYARESVSVDSILADNTYISAPFPKSISVGDQSDGIESNTDDKSPDMLATNSHLDAQESGSVDNGIMVSPYVIEAFPKLISGGDQTDEIDSDMDNKSLDMLAINSHLDVQDSGSVDHTNVNSPYISELFPKLITGSDQHDEIESDADSKSLDMLAIKSHLDVHVSGSVDHVNGDSSYISELFPKLISGGGDQHDEIENDMDDVDGYKSPVMLAINSHLDLLDSGSVDHINADSPCISELCPKLISGSDQCDEIESDTDTKSLEMLAINSRFNVQETGSVNDIEVGGPNVSEAPNFISRSDQCDGIESDTDDYMDALNTIESESESDIDCQTKGEGQKHYPDLNNDAMDARLHVFTVYPSDHHPFGSKDSKLHTASCISSDQGMSRHLCSSVSTEHEQLPKTAGKSSDQQGSLVSFLGSAEDPICWKSRSVSSKPPPSGPEGCIALAPIGDEIITKFSDVYICDSASNVDCSNLESFSNYSSAGQSAQASSENNIITGFPVIDYIEYSDDFGSIFESLNAEPLSSSSFCSSQAPSIDDITTRSVVGNICENTGNHDCSDLVSDSSIQLSPSPEVHIAQVSSDNKIITSLPENGCQSSDNFGNLKFELVNESSSGSVCRSLALSGDKINKLPDDICESVCGLDFSKFESVGGSAVCSAQASGEDKIITSLPVANCENSDVCSTFDPVYAEPSFSCSTSAPQPPGGDSIIVRSLVADICVSAGNPIHLKFDYSSTDQLSSSSSISNPSIIDIHESSGNPECSNFESDSSVLSSFSSTVLNSEATSGSKIRTNLSNSRETDEEFPDQSVKFWTNGGLLGLQPSKPPDCAVSHTARVESIAKFKDDTTPKNTIIGHNDDGCKGEMDILVKGSKNTEKDPSSKSPVFENDLEDAIPNKNTSKEVSLACADAKLEKNSDHHHSIILKQACKCATNESSEISSTVMPEAEMSDDLDIKITCTTAKQKGDANSFLFPGLTHKTTVNGSQSEAPLAHGEDRSEPAGGHGSVACQVPHEMTSIHQLDYGILVHSPSSSPPLEHMKISFQPTFGFEAPKLQLKFPDKSESYENIGDMFPSFQLVPEAFIPPDESGSNSDDDTFCRSSPYMLDEYLCHHSDSNSDQWESGETPPNMDHDLHDALHRISSLDVESISNSLEFEGTTHKGVQGNSVCESSCPGNGMELFHRGHLPELPSFDALNPLIQQETENISIVDISRLQPPKEAVPVPPPPPPPPLQCQTMKSLFNEAESRQDDVFDMKILESSISQQPMPVPAKQLNIVDKTLILPPKSKQGYLKFNIQTKAKHPSDGFGMDGKKDYLQQIRARSFSLRPIAMAKSVTSGPATNTKVTAILEKANAIRQVVGSDDDDNWSDA